MKKLFEFALDVNVRGKAPEGWAHSAAFASSGGTLIARFMAPMCIQFWILAFLLLVATSRAQTAIPSPSLPLWFEANHGQAGMTAPFAAHGPESAFFITATNAQFVLRKPSGETAATCMKFIGANSAAEIAGQAEMPGKVNYFIGNDPAQWRSGVPVFANVRVDNLYPGVNVVYYGNGRQLEYDFDLAPGVDPQTIAIRFDGAGKISVNPEGELVVSLNGGQVIQHRPVVYQETGLTRHEIYGGYKILDAHTATFALGNYDHTQPLVIDPILSYSTYFEGNNGNVIRAIALDTNGFIYVAGYTTSTVFSNAPSSGYQTNFQGGSIGDAFVAKFDNLGSNFIYFTYLGGSADEAAFGLAVDHAGNVFVTGFTDSANFPHTTNAFQPQIAGTINPVTHEYPVDAFVTELNTNGSSLVYSTFLGGSQADAGTAITVDANDNAYVVGYTFSTNFPVQPGAYQSTLQCPYTLYINGNAFLAEVAPGGSGLKYATYFGGTNFDEATAVALDPSNFIYVAGLTDSSNFPSINPLPGNKYLNGSPAGVTAFDAFVAKFTPGFTNNTPVLNAPVYSTFLGGSNYDAATGIIADNAGNAYVVGLTSSTNFPVTTNALFSSVYTNVLAYAAVTNAFLTKIGWNGTQAVTNFSVVFGGTGNDVANGVGMDSAGDIFVVGSASSTNFPVTTNNLTGSLSATNSASSPTQSSDVVVTAFNANGFPLYSAYLGGYLDDFGNAIAVDPSGNAYIAGVTISTNFPTFNARQTILSGPNDGFLAKILLTTTLPVLTATRAGTNLLISWQPVGEETPANSQLLSNTNLISTNWTVVTTNFPATNNGTYIYTLPHTNPAQFFRLHLY